MIAGPQYAKLSTGQTKAAYPKALGLEAPKAGDLGKLAFPDETLRPAVRVNPQPGVPPSAREEADLVNAVIAAILHRPEAMTAVRAALAKQNAAGTQGPFCSSHVVEPSFPANARRGGEPSNC